MNGFRECENYNQSCTFCKHFIKLKFNKSSKCLHSENKNFDESFGDWVTCDLFSPLTKN